MENVPSAVVLIFPAEVQRHFCTAYPSSSLVLSTLLPSAGKKREENNEKGKFNLFCNT